MSTKDDVVAVACSVAVIVLVLTFLSPNISFRGLTTSGTITGKEKGGSAGGEPDSDSEPESVALGFYSDSEATSTLTEIDWEIMSPSESKDKQVYVRNEDSMLLQIDSVTTQNWTPPEAQQYITLNWSMQDSFLEADEVQPLTLTLSIAHNITGIDTFEFMVIVWYDK